MSPSTPHTLLRLFEPLRQAISAQRDRFNQLDTYNGNHGDHLVEVFDVIVEGFHTHANVPLPEALQTIAEGLATCPANGTARVYAEGLRHMATHFRRYELTEAHLFQVAQALPKAGAGFAMGLSTKSALLKALAGALEDWRAAQEGAANARHGLSLGSMFAFGMAFLEAKAKCDDELSALAETAASLSPLSSVPHRYASGKFIFHHLLLALNATAQPQAGV